MSVFGPRAVLVVLAACVALSGIGSAQTDRREQVKVTFRLTLHGKVPPGEAFAVNVVREGVGIINFCTSRRDLAFPPCRGGGATYEYEEPVPRGEAYGGFPFSVGYKYVWEGEEYFLEGFLPPLETDHTISAYYAFGSNGEPLGGGRGDGPPGGARERPTPTGLPNTGSGGAGR